MAVGLLSSCTQQYEEPVVSRPFCQFIRTENGRTVTTDGNPVVLQGVNLGNWLLLEMWMMEISDEVHDEQELWQILEDRFGTDEAERLKELHRSSWVMERDFEIIKSFGFNCIRLPFDYTLLCHDEVPFVLKSDAFKWLDQAVAWAEAHELYVILDMHGLPGRQSVDHTTGEAGRNELWDSEENMARAVWLWSEIAKRYKDNPVVAAYEPVNEPFGDYETEKHAPKLVELIDRCHEAIRKAGVENPIIACGTRAGLDCYGDPRERAWRNVIFSEHYYPGVHYGEAGLEIHKELINKRLYPLHEWLKSIDTPFLLGEFNVVLRRAGGPMLMRHYYDVCEERGWWATMWCYKLVQNYAGSGQDNWYMVKNAEMPVEVSIRNSDLSDIEAFFRWFGEMDYFVYEDLQQALTTENPPQLLLEEPAFTLRASQNDEWDGWSGTDIACEPEGGQEVHSETRIDVYGGGRDIWNKSDEFRFVWQRVRGAFELEVTVDSLEEVNTYSKAGIMVRASTESDSNHVLLHVFPDGQVAMAWRDSKGWETKEKKFPVGHFPIRLKLVHADGETKGLYAFGDGAWKEAGSVPWTWQSPFSHAGLAVLSHDDRFVAKAEFSGVRLSGGEE